MSNEEQKPPQHEEYRRRAEGTKERAQRIVVDYQARPRLFGWMWKASLAASVLAALAIFPFLGRGRERVFARAPLSRAHAIFENNCAQCHAAKFAGVSDSNCQACHEGAPHSAKVRASETERCLDCHREHRGRLLLAEVDDSHCTRCHADLAKHGNSDGSVAASVMRFEPGMQYGAHPDLKALFRSDERPILFNHARHMTPAKIGRRDYAGMECRDCHVPDPDSRTGAMLPVTFEKHCGFCHANDLQFDNPEPGEKTLPSEAHKPGLPSNPLSEKAKLWWNAIPPVTAPVVPHARDAAKIRATVQAAYTDPRRASSALDFLAGNCKKCHTVVQIHSDAPVLPVNAIHNRYAEMAPDGEPWLSSHTMFDHRVHRLVSCEDCHTTASKSTRTADVLLPEIRVCTSCHNGATEEPNRCSECHTYHQRNQDLQHGRPIRQLTGGM